MIHRIRVIPSATSLIPAFIGMLALITACRKAPEPTTKLRVGYSPYSVNLVTFAAFESGALKQAGFDASMIPFQSTDALASALANGEIDVASALTAESVYSTNAKTPGLVMPFFYNTYSAARAVDGIIAANAGAADNIGFYAHKKIAVLPANMMRIALTRHLEKIGLKQGDYELVSLPPASILGAISNGDVVAAYVLEPMITVAQKRSMARLIATGLAASSIVDPLPAGFHCMRTEWAKRFPLGAQRLVESFKKSAERVMSAPATRQTMLTKYAGIDPAIADDVVLPGWGASSPELRRALRSQFDALAPGQGWAAGDFDKTRYYE